ncbi:MAG TPA: hypothetical protein VJK49_03415 [Candidatus Limnocylindrales bacterium]|nr:hypothetical protein [Candidatus Limnocylindrales bacterium]
MNRARWRDQIVPPVVVLGTALLLNAAIPTSLLGPATIAAGRAQPPAAAACPPPSAIAAAVNRHDAAGRLPVTLDPVISTAGELTAQVLAMDTAAGLQAIDLPAESFVGQPIGDLLVYTSHTPATGSVVHLVDLATGCDAVAVKPTHIVRSAVIAPDGSSIYAHSVTRASRRDNGVARFDLAGASSVVVPPLPESDAFGPTFGTLLRWSSDGAALAVQSCGFEACRTRILDVATGRIATFAPPGQGAFIALTTHHLVTFAACAGLPCDVLSTDLASGATATLAGAAWSASSADQADGNAIVTIETAAETTEVIQ